MCSPRWNKSIRSICCWLVNPQPENKHCGWRNCEPALVQQRGLVCINSIHVLLIRSSYVQLRAKLNCEPRQSLKWIFCYFRSRVVWDACIANHLGSAQGWWSYLASSLRTYFPVYWYLFSFLLLLLFLLYLKTFFGPNVFVLKYPETHTCACTTLRWNRAT